MIHDLYLRAHIVVPGAQDEDKHQPTRRSRAPKLWPDYALVWDTETTLDLEQTLNFGVWRFCRIQGAEYVTAQEGVFYRDGLAAKDIQTILAYKQKHWADGLASGAKGELTALSQSEFIERIFWESVRAGALIVGFNLPFDIARIAAQWTPARNGDFSFVLSQLSEKRVENRHRPRIRIAPLNGVAEQIELTSVTSSKDGGVVDSASSLVTIRPALTIRYRHLSGYATKSGVGLLLHGRITRGEGSDSSPYPFTFHTYKKAASVAVATLRPAFRVARLSAERTFSFDSTNSASGTLMAEPAFKPSRSLRIVVTISLCFPLRPCGTSDCTIVLKCVAALAVRRVAMTPS
jgi:hypothetical protein